ncbi:LytR C-terminal domain-containing protein [Candidatus Woesebacteria bacterium]|nr:LytR C-terminal domain-containing protein [Candidatus Woesebacteria bacterium]
MIWKIIGIVVIVAVLVGGGFYYYQTRQTKPTAEETSISPTETPTATPTPEEVDKAEFEIEILNGSGIVGEAGRAQKLLEDASFKVASTGNADAYDYEETVIQAGAEVSDAWIEELTKELENDYTVKGTVEELDADADTDVVVIIGSKDENGDALESSSTSTTTKEDADDASSEAKTTTTPTKSPTPTKSN